MLSYKTTHSKKQKKMYNELMRSQSIKDWKTCWYGNVGTGARFFFSICVREITWTGHEIDTLTERENITGGDPHAREFDKRTYPLVKKTSRRTIKEISISLKILQPHVKNQMVHPLLKPVKVYPFMMYEEMNDFKTCFRCSSFAETLSKILSQPRKGFRRWTNRCWC